MSLGLIYVSDVSLTCIRSVNAKCGLTCVNTPVIFPRQSDNTTVEIPIQIAEVSSLCVCVCVCVCGFSLLCRYDYTYVSVYMCMCIRKIMLHKRDGYTIPINV